MVNLNLKIGYPNSGFEVNVVDFPIRQGNVTAILGVNGSGKSTFYKTLTGEIKPISGTISASLMSEIAIVAEHIALPDDCNVRDLVYLLNFDNFQLAKSNFTQVFNSVEPLLNRKVKNLSSGQKRILQIFLLLASGKRVIILDEACAYLDLKNKMMVFEAINSMSDSGATILYTSHDFDDFNDIDCEIYFFNNNVLEKYNGERTSLNLRNLLVSSC